MKAAAAEQHQPLRPIFGRFFPLRALWEGTPGHAALFPSEVSTRWFMRNNLSQLIEAEAAVKHRGTWAVDLEKLETIALRAAVDAAKASLRHAVDAQRAA